VKQVLSDISCTSKDAMAHWWAERFLKTWEDNKAELGDDVGTLVLGALTGVAEKSHSARLEWYNTKVWVSMLALLGGSWGSAPGRAHDSSSQGPGERWPREAGG
jgi:hypothetical protein